MSKKTPKNIPPPSDFASALGQLQQLVERMESGQLSLEEALQQFEEGVNLLRHCQKTLQTAEQQVKILLEKKGEEPTLAPFESDDGHVV